MLMTVPNSVHLSYLQCLDPRHLARHIRFCPADCFIIFLLSVLFLAVGVFGSHNAVAEVGYLLLRPLLERHLVVEAQDDVDDHALELGRKVRPAALLELVVQREN